MRRRQRGFGVGLRPLGRGACFELVGQASRHLRGGGDLGVRYTRQWQWDAGERWVRMDVAARQRQWFAVEDEFQAAFAGAPDVVFDVRGMPVPRSEFGWNWTLTGGATGVGPARSAGPFVVKGAGSRPRSSTRRPHQR